MMCGNNARMQIDKTKLWPRCSKAAAAELKVRTVSIAWDASECTCVHNEHVAF